MKKLKLKDKTPKVEKQKEEKQKEEKQAEPDKPVTVAPGDNGDMPMLISDPEEEQPGEGAKKKITLKKPTGPKPHHKNITLYSRNFTALWYIFLCLYVYHSDIKSLYTEVTLQHSGALFCVCTHIIVISSQQLRRTFPII